MKRLLMLVLAALALPAAAFAAVTTGGSTTIANGQATLVSDSTHAYSTLNFHDLDGHTLADLNSLSANVVSGNGWGGGSPRFEVGLSNSESVNVYLGDAPNFTTGNSGSTGDLLASALPRVDTSQLTGGTFYDTWAHAQALAGSATITGISLVVDGAWNAPQTFVFSSVSINGTAQNLVPAPTCTRTGLMVDGIDLTAAQIGGNVTGPLDATGCDIGVYYGTGKPGNVTGATITGARYFGVYDNGQQADVKNSTISNIGDNPFSGNQHGRAVFYASGATGEVSGNQIHDYQKNGVVATDTGTAVNVLNNTITGHGQTGTIAQNGVVILSGATALVKGNTISGNWYTGPTWVSYGLLMIDANGVKQQANSFTGNQSNLGNFGRGGGSTTANVTT